MSVNKKAKRPKKRQDPAPEPSIESGGRNARNLRGMFFVPLSKVLRRFRGRQSRSPHRSFRRTYRRDYVRQFEIPGYVAFSLDVWRTLWTYKKTLGLLVVVYAVISGIFIGFSPQSTYSELADSLRSSSGDAIRGDFRGLGDTGTLLAIGLSSGMNANVSEAQQLVASFMILMAWLTTVWLLRSYFAGQRPSLRDGLYNAGAPIVPTFLLCMLLVLQFVPVAIVTIGAAAAGSSGLIDGGVESMLFWTFAFLLVLLTLYWITSTLIALVVVTLPGMYPVEAVRTANRLVLGRRFPILLRILWLLGVSLVNFIVIMVPVILLDAWIKGALPFMGWVPVVPFAFVVTSALTVVWAATYIYLLYRRIIDDSDE